MNLKGWVIFPHSKVEAKTEKRDSILMNDYIARGAKYFITDDINSVTTYKPLMPYTKDLFGHYNHVYVFRLPGRHDTYTSEDSVHNQLPD